MCKLFLDHIEDRATPNNPYFVCFSRIFPTKLVKNIFSRYFLSVIFQRQGCLDSPNFGGDGVKEFSDGIVSLKIKKIQSSIQFIVLIKYRSF